MKSLLVLGLMAIAFPSFAEQSSGEKAEVQAKNAKRSIKKGAHRVGEKLCMKDDAKCAADKAKHRLEEGGDAVKDKGSEIKDKMD